VGQDARLPDARRARAQCLFIGAFVAVFLSTLDMLLASASPTRSGARVDHAHRLHVLPVADAAAPPAARSPRVPQEDRRRDRARARAQ
jgi:hypothetical protein